MARIDWTDETPRLLDEVARIAFPAGGVTAGTLRRRAREGKLDVSRPGKSYMTTLRAVRRMLEACRVKPATRARQGISPMHLDEDLASRALDQALVECKSAAGRRRYPSRLIPGRG
jgi:hypothetical protein